MTFKNSKVETASVEHVEAWLQPMAAAREGPPLLHAARVGAARRRRNIHGVAVSHEEDTTSLPTFKKLTTRKTTAT